jgi:hypothetical protein
MVALLDAHLLRDLLADDLGTKLAQILDEHEPATTNTNLYLHRLSRSVVSARGGALTGLWPGEHRRELGRALLALPESVRPVVDGGSCWELDSLGIENPELP